ACALPLAPRTELHVPRVHRAERAEPLLARDPRELLVRFGVAVLAIDQEIGRHSTRVPRALRPGDDRAWCRPTLSEERILPRLIAHGLHHRHLVAELRLHSLQHALEPFAELGRETRESALDVRRARALGARPVVSATIASLPRHG